jgi:serine/threonine protein kinase
MQRSPVSAWQELSALYEQADELEGAALQSWLATPRIAGHAQLQALRRMLAARERLRDSDFLNAPPSLEPPAPAGVETQGLRVGVPIGPYRLLHPLGAGGMAEVWLAERSDGAFQRRVAIKLMFRQVGGAARDSVAQRFARERDILASLDHPNIAALHDAGVTPGGQPWLALEYVEGRPLTDWCDHARLGVAERVRLFRQVLLAVQHAHAKLVMHRDLKPANILVADTGQVHLLDFGIAKLTEPGEGAQADTELTRAAGRLMTPLYASPEQLRGEPLTIACDIYALGVVLYELLSGERPYEVKAGSAARLEQAILEADPRAPSRRALREEAAGQRGLSVKALRKALAGDLDAIVLQALAKLPAQRYASADAMLADIDRWLGGEPVNAHAPSAVYRWGKFVRRNRLGVGLGASAVMALAGVATVAVIQGQQAQRESARAVAARDFMIEMFKHADVAKARGADVTAREMLENGRRDISARLGQQPELQSDLLQAIASIQHEMGEYLSADATYEEVVRLLAGRQDDRGVAVAQTARAESVFQLGDFSRTLALIEGARSASSRSGGSAELETRLDWLEGLVRSRRQEPELARTMFERSLQQAGRVFGPNHIRSIEALQGLSMLSVQRRDFPGALAIQADISARAKASRLSAREVAQIDHTRIFMLSQAGRTREAFAQAGSAAQACAGSAGPGDEMCRWLVIHKVIGALRLGMAEAVRPDLPTLQAAATEDQAPELQARALQGLCRVRAALDATKVDEVLERRLVQIWESADATTFSPDLKASSMLALADASLRTRAPLLAQTRVEQVLNGISAQDLSPSTRAWAKHLLGVALLAQGRHEAALVTLREAHADYASLLGADHAMTLTYAMNQAIALAALGRHAEAQAIVRRAQPVLREAMGDDAPTYRSLLEVQRRLDAVLQHGTRGDVPSPANASSPLFI